MANGKANKTMGEMISKLRKEKGMTQKEIADLLFITDKAVSKWERDVSCPDSAILPKLCEILEIPIEELMSCKTASQSKKTKSESVFENILKAITFSCGVATAVFGISGMLSAELGFSLLGVGLACAGFALLLND